MYQNVQACICSLLTVTCIICSVWRVAALHLPWFLLLRSGEQKQTWSQWLWIQTTVSSSQRTFHLDLHCKFFWYEDTRLQCTLQCTAWDCILCVSQAQTISYSFYSSHPHVFSFSFSLISSCWSILYVSWSLCFLTVTLLCFYLYHRHTCTLILFIFAVSHSDMLQNIPGSQDMLHSRTCSPSSSSEFLFNIMMNWKTDLLCQIKENLSSKKPVVPVQYWSTTNDNVFSHV